MSTIRTPHGKKRERLDPPKRDMTPAHTARDKAFAEAPRLDDGRMVPGFRYKQILDIYEENGLEPRVVDPAQNTFNTRPPMFVSDPKIAKRMIKGIRKGHPYTTVCRAVGVSRETFLKWLQRGREGDPLYVDFYHRVQRAEAKAETDIFDRLSEHEKNEWKVSAWKLERRWPEHWARRDAFRAEQQVNLEVNLHTKEDLGKHVLNDDASRELARRMIDGDEYGYDDVTTERPGG